ncbi:tetratricopeptide repeat-containing sulfotransferase family protein [Sphingomonas gilva]|nr:sulfotransferase [Sphingomonas gilva]
METNDLLGRLKAALASRRRASVNEAIVDLLAAPPRIGRSWKSVALAARRNGELTLARACAARMTADGVPEGPYEEAAMAALTGQLEEARKLAAHASPSGITEAALEYLRGTIALNSGELILAEAHFDAARLGDPSIGQTYLALASLRDMAAAPELAEIILDAREKVSTSNPFDRAAYHYALGKTLDDLDEPERAFEEIAAGARIMANLRPYDRNADASLAQSAIRGFDGARIAAFARSVDSDNDRPILVTGSPRSGTTLLQEMLVRHSAVADGDELDQFSVLLREIGGNGAGDLERYQERLGGIDALARLYLRLLTERFGTGGRIVDKSLNASRYLGQFAAVLPGAPLIWMRRSRLENAWSCLKTFFAAGINWSWSQEDIAHHFHLEDKLLERWQAILGDRLLIVDYEDLVQDTRSTTGGVLRHCRLPEEESVFGEGKGNRTVTTASVVQARQPIYRRGLDRARRYRERLQPFVTAYRSFGGKID